MPTYAVDTIFGAKDRVSSTYDKMGRHADRFGQKSSSAFRNATKEGYKFGTIVKGILAANALRGGIGYITSGIQETGNQFLQFDDTLVGALARFDDAGKSVRGFSGELADLKRNTLDAIRGTQYKASDAAKGINDLIKAGFSPTESVGSLRSMMALSTTAQEDFARTISMSNDLLGAFGLRTSNATQNIKNFSTLNDKMAKALNLSNLALEDLFETSKTTGPVTGIIKMDLNEILALTAVLGNIGIKGTEAATSIKNMVLNLAQADNQAELLANGIDVRDRLGNMRKVSDILGEMHGKLKGLGNVEQAQILNRIFGLRAIAGSQKLMENLGFVADYTQKIGNATGENERVSALISKYSTLVKLQMLGNAVLEKAFTVLDQFNYKGQQGVEALIAKIRAFDTKPIVDALSATGNIIGVIYTAVKPLLPALPYLIAGFGTLKVVTAAVGFIQMASGAIRFLMAIRPLIGTMGILNAVMAANPVGLIVVGIGAAIAAVVYLEKRFKLFSTALEYWKDKFLSIVSGVKGVLGWFGSGIGLQMDDREPPNRQEAQARARMFLGQLNIAGAPPGSSVETKSAGAPSIQMHLLGANP